MATVDEDMQLLLDIRAKIGTARYDSAVRKINRMRLDAPVAQRQKRIKFKWSMYSRLYKKQKGICPICGDAMPLIQGMIEIDHKNPNEEDFNNDSNLQVTHKDCNRSKGADSVSQQSKSSGRTYKHILSGTHPGANYEDDGVGI